jgi:hypothetical protein
MLIVCVDVWSLDNWSRIGGNASRRDQSHVNTRHEVLDWFGSSCGVIALHLLLLYYTIEIGSSLFLLGCPSGSFGGFSEDFFSRGCLLPSLDVDLSSLFIVGELPHRV